MVSVNYEDILAVTLPYNRHHFHEVMVVTCYGDASIDIARANRAEVYVTDAFTRDGAYFNKWAALEEGLDVYGRHGELCIMDADVLWPKEIPPYERKVGFLYSPLRYMLPSGRPIPDESEWSKYPIHPNTREWAGFTQIFHADDPHLPNPPWHQTDWVHAGGADSFFQLLWPPEYKIRCPFNVLHLGEAGLNWYGRATPYLDGRKPDHADTRLSLCRRIWEERRRLRGLGQNPFIAERLRPGRP